MLRRSLPVVAAAAAALAFTTGTASAAPAPVDHFAYAGYFATVDAHLLDGRTVTATLTQYYGENQSVSSGFLGIYVQPPCGVASTGRQCAPWAIGSTALSGDQVEFDRGLRGASVTDIPLTLTTPEHYVWNTGMPGGPSPDGMPPMPGEPTGPVLVPEKIEAVTVSFDFTGTGAISRDAQHTLADYCGGDSTGCQSTGVTARRTADVVGALAWASGGTDSVTSGDGSLLFDQSVANVMPVH